MFRIFFYTSCLLAVIGCNPIQISSSDLSSDNNEYYAERKLSINKHRHSSSENNNKIYPSRLYKVDESENDYFITAIQNKFLQDMTAFSQLNRLGIKHCISEDDYMTTSMEYYNEMYPLARLTNRDKVKDKLANFEISQNIKKHDEETCRQTYRDGYSYDFYRNFMKDKKLYSVEHGYDPIQDDLE